LNTYAKIVAGFVAGLVVGFIIGAWDRHADRRVEASFVIVERAPESPVQAGWRSGPNGWNNASVEEWWNNYKYEVIAGLRADAKKR